MRVRAGRQQIGDGDQRLIGPGNWGNTSRTFDAVKLSLERKFFTAEVFAASVVAQFATAWDHHVDGDNLHGAALWLPDLPRRESRGGARPVVRGREGGAGYAERFVPRHEPAVRQ